MAKQKLPCPTALRLLLRYEPETGRLFWSQRGKAWFSDAGQARSWNTRYAGREAFRNLNLNGYLMGYVLDSNLVAQRVIMAIVDGKWPDDDVDHIDGDRQNNRLVNLRHATRAENLRNSGSRKGSSSRFCGVSWDKARGRWTANCTDKVGHRRHLGRFVDETEAARAYDRAARHWHGEFARLNFPEAFS